MKPLVMRAMVWAAVAAGRLATLARYQRPDFLVNLADQIWSCF